MKLSKDTLILICARQGPDEVQMWSNIPIDDLFSDYRIESNSDNCIALDIPIEALLLAIRSAHAPSSRGSSLRAAADISMKLTKKDDVPYLVIEITAETKEGKKVKVEHDVNVVLRRVSEVDEMSQPLCPPFEVHVELPHADALRPVVEHLARISDIIWFSATRDGRFRLGVESDSGDVETMWTGVKNVKIRPTQSEGGDEEDEDKDEDADKSTWVSAPLTAKTLQRWLSSQVVQADVIAGIAPMYCIVAYVYIGDKVNGGVVTYYIPARTDGKR